MPLPDATANVGVPFISPVAHFTDSNLSAIPSDFGTGFLTVGQSLGGTYHAQPGSITIAWGDGSNSSAGIAVSGMGDFYVYTGPFGQSGHSYQAPGTYTIHTLITDDSGDTPLEVSTTVNVKPFSVSSLQSTLDNYAAQPSGGAFRPGDQIYLTSTTQTPWASCCN